MIHSNRFRISDRPYAVDLSSFTRGDVRTGAWCCIDAVWFRRRRGTTVAVAGNLHYALHHFDGKEPKDATDFLERYTDGRYGGTALARWDGANLWAPQMDRDTSERYYELLRRTLDGFPDPPAGFLGWWRFDNEQYLASLAARRAATDA